MCRKERESACAAVTNRLEQPADRDGEAPGRRTGMEMSVGEVRAGRARQGGPEWMSAEKRERKHNATVTHKESERTRVWCADLTPIRAGARSLDPPHCRSLRSGTRCFSVTASVEGVGRRRYCTKLLFSQSEILDFSLTK